MRQSDLKQFGTCGMQYFYSRVLEIGEQEVGSPTVLGTVFHYAIDVYETYDHDLNLALRTFDLYWENPYLLGETIDFWHRRTTFNGLKKRGREMLKRYHELAPWREGRNLGTEIQFVVPIGEHELTGTIDKLWMRPGQKKLEIIDFKTGSAVPEKLRYNIQFSAYCYATTRPEFWQFVPGFEDAYERFDGWSRGGWWYHARNNKMFNAGQRRELDYKRVLLAIDQLNNAIEKEVFPLDIKGENCGYCRFADSVCGSEVSLERLYG